MQRSSLFTRTIAGALSVCTFVTQVVFAGTTDVSLWKERRKPAPIQLARLSSNPATALPALPLLHSAQPALDRSALPTRFRLSDARLRDLVAAIPGQAGDIRRLTTPENPRAVVVHIQDVHRNFEAQTNISRVVSALSAARQADVVAIEGEFRPLDLSAFQSYPNPDVIRMGADYLLHEHSLPGSVHAALTTKNSPRVIGVDDEVAHGANVQAYRASLPAVKAAQSRLEQERIDLMRRKQAAFSSELSLFDAQIQDYRSGKLGFGAYVHLLARTAGDEHPSPSVQVFLAALKEEEKLDQARIEEERTRIIRALADRVPTARMNALLDASVAYRAGRIRHTDFYRLFEALARENGIDLARFPAMRAYIDYVLLTDSIDGEALLSDIRSLETAAYNALASTPAAKELVAADRHAYLAGRLVDFSLTRDEWEEYQNVPRASYLVPRKYSDVFRGTENEARGTILSPFEDFYRLAVRRDAAMAANLLSSLQSIHKDLPVAVLVTGGFHDRGLARELAKNRIAVLTVVPRITKVSDNEPSYLTAFMREKSSLDQLFMGEKLFLADGIGAGMNKLALVPPAVNPADAAAEFKRVAPNVNRTASVEVLKVGDENVVRVAVSDPATGKTTLTDVRYTVQRILSMAPVQEFGTRYVASTILLPAVLLSLAAMMGDISVWHLVTAGILGLLSFQSILARYIDDHGSLSDGERAWLKFFLPFLAILTEVFFIGGFSLLLNHGVHLAWAVVVPGIVAASANMSVHGIHNAEKVLAVLTRLMAFLGSRLVPVAADINAKGLLSLVNLVERAPDGQRRWKARHRGFMTLQGSTQFRVHLYPIEGTATIAGTSVDPLSAAQGLDYYQRGLGFLKQFYADMPSFRDGMPTSVSVRFVDGHESVVSVEGTELIADAGLVERLESEDREVVVRLIALNLAYVLRRRTGDDERTALHHVIQLYSRMEKSAPELIKKLHDILHGPVVDSDNLLSILLRKASAPAPVSSSGHQKVAAKVRAAAEAWYHRIASRLGIAFEELEYPDFLPAAPSESSAEETQHNWRERWIVWFLSMRRFDSPVDLEKADEILNSANSKDVQAWQLLNEVDSRSAYDSENEAENARRMRSALSEADQTLTVSRFGRASYFLTMLASASRFIIDLQIIESTIASIASTSSNRMNTDPDFRQLKQAGVPHNVLAGMHTLLNQTQSDVTDLRILIQPDRRPTKAALTGAINRMEASVNRFSSDAAKRLQGARLPANQAMALTDLINKKAGIMLQAARQLKEHVETMPEKRANFSVLVQRSSITGVRALNHLRLNGDPFEGGEEHIAEVQREGADMTYGSSDDIWFEVADYWVEALPLFIHEEQIELGNGKKLTKVVIEQEAMETALRRLAIRWKGNIDGVMASEHMALAREHVVRSLPALENYASLLMEHKSMDRETAVLETLRFVSATSPHTTEEIRQVLSGACALIEGTWRNLADTVSGLQGRRGMTRYDALADVLDNNHSSRNLLHTLLTRVQNGTKWTVAVDQVLHEADEGLQSSAVTFRHSAYREGLLKTGAALEKRRKVPTWIILTTQASGMSDAFAGHWVDEEMALYNLTTGFTHDGISLEQEAIALQKRHEKRIVVIAQRLITQFGLDHKIDEMIATGGARDRHAAALSLLRSYHDLAEEVAKVYAILELNGDAAEEAYSVEPDGVFRFFNEWEEDLKRAAVVRVIQENDELASLRQRVESGDVPLEIAGQEEYRDEVQKYMWSLARDRAIDTLGANEEDGHARHIQRMARWYAYSPGENSLPRILRMRLSSDKGMTTARQEVVGRYWLTDDGRVILDAVRGGQKGRPLSLLMNDPVYGYAATGKNKKYNRGYGPSRVDLGNWERFTTEVLTQWIGPADDAAREAMEFFYGLYNFNVRPFDKVGEAEQMKPFENAMMESALAVTHLFIPMFQTIGVGNMLHLAYETNQRSETKIRAGGAGSCGFCQPKDIYFLPFVTTALSEEIMEYAGIPINGWESILEIRRNVLTRLKETVPENENRDEMEQQIIGIFDRAKEEMDGKLGAESHLFGPARTLPPVSSLEAQQRIGAGDVEENSSRALSSLIADYHADVIKDLESRMRFTPVHLIRLLKDAFERLHQMDPSRPSWEQAIITLPVEYKPVSDPRLSTGLRVLELLADSGEHLMLSFGEDGQALARLILSGFDENDAVMTSLIAEKAFESDRLTPEQVAALNDAFPRREGRGGPQDVRMVSPFNLAAEAIYNYVAGSHMREQAAAVRRTMNRYGLKDEVISANAITHGARLTRWQGHSLKPAKLKELEKELANRIHLLVMDERLNNADYRATTGSDLWESVRGADVFTTMVHYPEQTGSEDEAGELNGFGQIGRMIDDLARVRDTMTDGRPNSALIWFDAPVQGRKVTADEIAIKQWLALGGAYVSPTISQDKVVGNPLNTEETHSLRSQMEEERYWSGLVMEALRASDLDRVNEMLKSDEFKDFIRRHHAAARREERFAREAGEWWRGAGFNNGSARHRLYSEGWARLMRARSVSDLDLGALVVMGGMHHLNGRQDEEILQTLREVGAALADNDVDGTIVADTIYLFVKPMHEEIRSQDVGAKGESISMKKNEDSATSAAGQARANYEARQRARALTQRVSGYSAADKEAPSVMELADRAYGSLGDGRATISNENFGRFMALTEESVKRTINEVVKDEELRNAMHARAAPVFDRGRKPSPDSWVLFMGKGDDKGDIGRMALEADGDKEKLAQIARVAGLMDTLYALLLTLEFQQMDDADVERFGAQRLHAQVNETIGMFFARTIYDHTWDYFPTWMHPGKSGTGFTNYDTIMGRWLGHGAPLTRDECLALAVDNHRWLDVYLDQLIRTKTWMRHAWENNSKRKSNLEQLLGNYRNGQGQVPIGAAGDSFSDVEKEWWSYTQKRELAFFEQQGHRVAAVFDDLDAVEVLDAHNRTTLAISAPTGRPHLTVALKEQTTYNQEYPDAQANIVLGRAYDIRNIDFDGDGSASETHMLIPNGFMYMDRDSYIRARVAQLHQLQPDWPMYAYLDIAEKEADAALKNNPKGIPVAVRFRQPLINHFSMPFHGAGYYQTGWDERIGLPTAQAWIHNLTPGYSKVEEKEVYKDEGEDLYPAEAQWYQRFQTGLSLTVILDRIKNGFTIGGHHFPGLINLTFWRLISKPSRQSGGRGAAPMQIRDNDGQIIETALDEFARNLADQGERDDQVIQQLISSTPYVWGSPTMIDAIRDGLIRKGIDLPPGAPLFVYSRVITIYVDGKMEYVLELVVSSRMAVSNVGLGGVLFKWRKSFGSTEELAERLSLERRDNARRSMELIERRAREVWRKIRDSDEELAQSEPHFALMKKRLSRARTNEAGEAVDRTGWAYAKPRYIMHDLLDVPVVQFEPGSEPVVAPDILDVKYTHAGGLESLWVLDKRGSEWHQVRITPDQIVGWKAIKIEDNIGYGLWQPYDQDEQKEERARAAATGEPVNPMNWGRDIRRILHSFIQAGGEFRLTLPTGLPRFPSGPPHTPASPAPVPQPSVAVSAPPANLFAQAVVDARLRLHLPANAPLSQDHFSVVLKAYVTKFLREDGMRAIREGSAENPRLPFLEIFSAARRCLTDGVTIDRLAEEAVLPEELAEALANNRFYVHTIAMMVADEFYTLSSDLEIQVSLSARTSSGLQGLIGPGRTHVVIFDDWLGLRDELARLVASAEQSSMETGTPVTNIVAVHPNWMYGANVYEHAIVYIRETGEMKLISLMGTQPLRVDHAQVLALSGNESSEHRALTRTLQESAVPQVNPVVPAAQGLPGSAADTADSKYATTNALQYRVSTPQGLLLEGNAKRGADAPVRVREFLSRLMIEGRKESVSVRISPDRGTEGRDHAVFTILKQELSSVTASHPLMVAIADLKESSGDVIVREEIGNVTAAGRQRVSLRINVSHQFAGPTMAESGFAQVSRGDSVVSNSGRPVPISTVINDLWGNGVSVSLTESDFTRIKQTAIDALDALNSGLPPHLQLGFAGVDLVLECDEKGRFVKAWVVDVNARPTGLRHATRIERLRNDHGQLFVDQRVPAHSGLWQPAFDETQLSIALVRILNEDLDESHGMLFPLMRDQALVLAAEMLQSYLEENEASTSDPLLLLRQERAVVMVGDLLWTLKGRNRVAALSNLQELIRAVAQTPNPRLTGDARLNKEEEISRSIMEVLRDDHLHDDANGEGYLTFMNQFLKAADQRELADFEFAAQRVLRHVPTARSENLRMGYPLSIHRSYSGMRFGISSANARDNWTHAKMARKKGRLTRVLNVAVNPGVDVPVEAILTTTDEPGLTLETDDRLFGRGIREKFGDDGKSDGIFIGDRRYAAEDEAWHSFFYTGSPHDPMRFLKHALMFTGIIPADTPADQFMDRIDRFTGGRGLHLKLRNDGVSRSGFASSSTIAVNLLKVLYKASGQDAIADDPELLSSMAILFENQLGLRSGRQDTDGPIFPGVKEITYDVSGDGFLSPQIRRLNVNAGNMAVRFLLVDSGAKRPAATDLRSRGLNRRHLAYLARHPASFAAIEKSYGLHDEIVAAFETENWPLLGRLFLEYMRLREIIDPMATGPEGILRTKLFDRLVSEGVIHGGMFTGAMGGGIAMIVPTLFGLEPGATGESNLDRALREIREEGDLLAKLQPVSYGINDEGIQYEVTSSGQKPTVSSKPSTDGPGDHVVDTLSDSPIDKGLSEGMNSAILLGMGSWTGQQNLPADAPDFGLLAQQNLPVDFSVQSIFFSSLPGNIHLLLVALAIVVLAIPVYFYLTGSGRAQDVEGEGGLRRPVKRLVPRAGASHGLTWQRLAIHLFVGLVVSSAILFVPYDGFFISPWVDTVAMDSILIATALLAAGAGQAYLFGFLGWMGWQARGLHGYRLLWLLRRTQGIKISELALRHPTLVYEKGLFSKPDKNGRFKPEHANSLYKRIPYGKTLWLSDLHPSLPDEKITLVNELNAGPWSQIYLVAISLVYMVMRVPHINSTRLPARAANWGIYFWNQLAYLPAALLAFAFLIIEVVIELVWYLQYWHHSRSHEELLGAKIRRYLEDYEEPSTGVRYTRANIDYINSNPEIVLNGKVLRIKDLLTGTWQERFDRIVRNMPPVKNTGMTTFRSYYEEVVNVARDQSTTEKPMYQPLPADVDMINTTNMDPEIGKRRVQQALERGEIMFVRIGAGAGRRFVDNSPRVSDKATKMNKQVFDANDGSHGLRSAISLALDSLDRTVGEHKVKVVIVTQDENDRYVRDSILTDPELTLSDSIELEWTVLNSFPVLDTEGGILYIPPEELNMEPGLAGIMVSPAGAMGAVIDRVVDGSMIQDVLEGRLFMKVIAGEDTGGVPDGNEIRALEEGESAVLFSQTPREVGYRIRLGDGTECFINTESIRTVLSQNLPEGLSVELNRDGEIEPLSGSAFWDLERLKWKVPAEGQKTLNSLALPKIVNDQGEVVEYRVVGVQFQKLGTPMFDGQQAVVKDNHELGHVPDFEQAVLRLSTPYANSNQAIFHMKRFLLGLGLWKGDLDENPATALKAARAMSVDERRDHVIALLRSKNIPPAVDNAALSEVKGARRYKRLGWKLSDLLLLVKGGFHIIYPNGVDDPQYGHITSAFLALKDSDYIFKYDTLHRAMARVLRPVVGDSSPAFNPIPGHYRTIVSDMTDFIAWGVILGRDYWYPNRWHLPPQVIGEEDDGQGGKRPKTEVIEPLAQAYIELELEQVIGYMRLDSEHRDTYRGFFGPAGEFHEGYGRKAVRRYVNKLVLDLYRAGWQIVVQDQGQGYRGINVTEERVTFFIAPRSNGNYSDGIEPIAFENLEFILNRDYGVELKPWNRTAPGSSHTATGEKTRSTPSLEQVVPVGGIAKPVIFTGILIIAAATMGVLYGLQPDAGQAAMASLLVLAFPLSSKLRYADTYYHSFDDVRRAAQEAADDEALIPGLRTRLTEIARQLAVAERSSAAGTRRSVWMWTSADEQRRVVPELVRLMNQYGVASVTIPEADGSWSRVRVQVTEELVRTYMQFHQEGERANAERLLAQLDKSAGTVVALPLYADHWDLRYGVARILIRTFDLRSAGLLSVGQQFLNSLQAMIAA